MHFLEKILDALFPPRDTERLVREAGATSLEPLLAPSILTFPGMSVIALAPYRAALMHALIVEAKFYRNARATALLGDALAEYLLQELAEQGAYEQSDVMLIPVPLSAARARERGYNQVEEVCRHALEKLRTGATLAPETLSRTRDTLTQTSLGKEARAANMNEAFRAAPALNPSHTYIVIDDVVTTGATLRAARDALIAAGASRIALLALAH